MRLQFCLSYASISCPNCMKIYREFIAYLQTKFGTKWVMLLNEAQRKNSGESGVFHSDTPEFTKDWLAGIQVLSCYNNSTFTAWNRGSAMIFWRWHPSYINHIRDGFPPFVLSTPPSYWRKPRPFAKDHRLFFFSKIKKFIDKSYITPNSKIILPSLKGTMTFAQCSMELLVV